MTFDGRKIAVVLTPGGLPGIEAHAGAWLAMELAGIRPQQLCGCSAGAIVAAAWATGKYGAKWFHDYVSSLQAKQLIKKRLLWKTRLFWLEDFCDPEPLERRLWNLLPETFGELQIPLTISATCMSDWPESSVHFNTGAILRQAVRASSSIAGVWPYTEIAGHLYTDGGTTNAVVLPDNMSDYDLVLVVNPCREFSFRERDKNMISRLVWNLEQLQDMEPDRYRYQLDQWPQIRWLDLNIGDVSCLEFSADHKLIQQAFFKVRDWLRDILLERKAS